MTTPLSDLSRNLLAAARDGMSPDAAAAERVRARVAAAVGAPVAAGIVATPAKATAAIALPVKLGLIAVVIGAAAATVLFVRGGDDTRAPQLSTRGAEVDEVRSHHAVAAPEPEAPAATATPARPAPAPVTTLAREVELIDRAMIALRRGAAVIALDAIAVYDRETRGRGQMAEDAAAIAIEAHCALGDDVRGKLEAFEHAYPSSAQRARITETCRK